MNEPVPPKDPRHKKMADLFLARGNQTDAYLDAGFNCTNRNSAGAAAARAFARVDVQAYIRAVQKLSTDATVLTIIEKRQFLARVVRTPITALDPKKEENADLIKSYTVETNSLSTKTRLEKHDPIKAINLDNQLSGDDSAANATNHLADAIASLAAGEAGDDKM